MNKQNTRPIYLPIETPIGFLRGRDAIFLDALHYDGGELMLEGECNGVLASNTTERWIGYTLRFQGTLAFHVVELDSWEHCCYQPVLMKTCFWEVTQSKWLAKLGGKVTDEHRHFVIQTYDDVVEVVCSNYEFITRPQK